MQQVSLEAANSRVPLSLLRLLKDKQLMVGVIAVASQAVETPAEVESSILTALERARLR